MQHYRVHLYKIRKCRWLNALVDRAMRVRLKLSGGVRPTEPPTRAMTDTAMNAANTFAPPDEGLPTHLDVPIYAGVLIASLPAKLPQHPASSPRVSEPHRNGYDAGSRF